jgi:copper chaperone CopZ
MLGVSRERPVVDFFGPVDGPRPFVIGQRTDPARKCRWGALVVLGWLMSGCGSGDMTGKGGVEAMPVGEPAHGMVDPGPDLGVAWRFAVGGMHCEGCAGGVESEIRRVPGVHWGRVDFASGRAEVRVDTERVTQEALERVVVEAGYTVQWREP